MSDSERPDIVAARELESLVRHLGDELANFRRRALKAEADLKALGASGTVVADAGRVAVLESENATLRRRLDAAARRAGKMLERVRFLRQQQDFLTSSESGARAER